MFTKEVNPDVKISPTALKAIEDTESAEHNDTSLKPMMIPNVQPRELQDKKRPSAVEENLIKSGSLKKPTKQRSA
jgi:hypothetical protein